MCVWHFCINISMNILLEHFTSLVLMLWFYWESRNTMRCSTIFSKVSPKNIWVMFKQSIHFLILINFAAVIEPTFHFLSFLVIAKVTWIKATWENVHFWCLWDTYELNFPSKRIFRPYLGIYFRFIHRPRCHNK